MTLPPTPQAKNSSSVTSSQERKLSMKYQGPTRVRAHQPQSTTEVQAAVTLSVSTSSPWRAASMKISWKHGQPFIFFRSLGPQRFGACASSVTRLDSEALV